MVPGEHHYFKPRKITERGSFVDSGLQTTGHLSYLSCGPPGCGLAAKK